MGFQGLVNRPPEKCSYGMQETSTSDNINGSLKMLITKLLLGGRNAPNGMPMTTVTVYMQNGYTE